MIYSRDPPMARNNIQSIYSNASRKVYAGKGIDHRTLSPSGQSWADKSNRYKAILDTSITIPLVLRGSSYHHTEVVALDLLLIVQFNALLQGSTTCGQVPSA